MGGSDLSSDFGDVLSLDGIDGGMSKDMVV